VMHGGRSERCKVLRLRSEMQRFHVFVLLISATLTIGRLATCWLLFSAVGDLNRRAPLKRSALPVYWLAQPIACA